MTRPPVEGPERKLARRTRTKRVPAKRETWVASSLRASAMRAARDEKKNPFLSSFDWTEDAIPRILRVPAGFMRDRTQARIEVLAKERDRTEIDLALVEEGIEFGREQMRTLAS